MAENYSDSNPLSDLFSAIKRYVDLRTDEVKLALAENLAKIFGRIMFTFLVVILVGIVLGILAAALSTWLGTILGNSVYGMLVTAAIFIIFILILFLFKDRFMINSPLRMFLRMFFDKKDNGKEGK